jgi:hypothetical protein
MELLNASQERLETEWLLEPMLDAKYEAVFTADPSSE